MVKKQILLLAAFYVVLVMRSQYKDLIQLVEVIRAMLLVLKPVDQVRDLVYDQLFS